MKINYRADIDGLRAIAVLSVVFYHAGIPFFSGGFVGVDVFFVISGYLITYIILTDIEANDFSLANFYQRRIRRIFPALFTMLIFVFVAGITLFDPISFKNFGASLAASSFSFANILFWTQAGYFDSPSSLKPLLHTWSLAVEEQYYIFFPLLLAFLARYLKRQLRFVIVAFALTSFLLSLFAIHQGLLSSAFYLPHLRAWELLTGSILSLRLIPVPNDRKLATLLGLVGIILIGIAVFLYSKDTTFPGLAALPPVIGSALILFSGQAHKSELGKILSLPPLVFVGKISYSLYLWHWPIIIFGEYYLIRTPRPYEMTFLLFFSFVISILSWRFVEQPLRRTVTQDSNKFLVLAGTTMLFGGLLGFLIYTGKLTGVLVAKNEISISMNEVAQDHVINCDLDEENPASDTFLPCIIGAQNSEAVFLVWGDSHANTISQAIQYTKQINDMTGSVLTMKGCPPLLDIKRQDVGTCVAFNRRAIKYLENHPKIKYVFLAARWALYSEGTRYKTEDGETVVLTDTRIKSQETGFSNATLLKVGLSRTIEEINALHRKVVIVMEIPEIGYDVPSSYFIARQTGRNINAIIAPTRGEYLQRNQSTLNVMTNIQRTYGIRVLYPAETLCNSQICPVVINDHALYVDSQHLSPYGVMYISSIFDALVDEMASQKQ